MVCRVLALLLASCALAASGAEQTLLRRKTQQQGSGSGSGSGSGGAMHVDGFVKALNFKHQLRACNAYPFAAALDIYRGKAERLTGDAPMGYKSCRDFSVDLKQGDKLEFRIGDASAGTFSVSDLPNNDAVLLLVIHRHDALSTAVAFESHVFASLETAQVAVIDTYKGSKHASPKIMDASAFFGKQAKDGKEAKATPPRSEDLRYDSVVAVNPGVYEVALEDAQDGSEVARSRLVALKRESYVVLRTGVEAQQGPSFPEELVIFPNPDPAQLPRSAAGRAGAPRAAVLGGLAALLGVCAAAAATP